MKRRILLTGMACAVLWGAAACTGNTSGNSKPSEAGQPKTGITAVSSAQSQAPETANTAPTGTKGSSTASASTSETSEDVLDRARALVQGCLGEKIHIEGNVTDRWISFKLPEKDFQLYLDGYETSGDIRAKWNNAKEKYREASGALGRIAPGYSLVMRNPLSPGNIVLTLKGDEVLYDYFAELEIMENETSGSPSRREAEALEKAQNYLSFSAFSKEGLIDQLQSEGFSEQEAGYAVDEIEVDWSSQALSKAQAYLEFSAFSRKGLKEQLKFEKFTEEQSEYAVEQIGADWFEQAAIKAKAYLDFRSFSHSELVDQLEFDGFTTEQAEAGARASGI